MSYGRSIRRGRATATHYTHHQVSLMVSCNTTLVPSLGLRIGPACEAGLSAGMQREHVSPQIRKKERKKERKKDRQTERKKERKKERQKEEPHMLLCSDVGTLFA